MSYEVLVEELRAAAGEYDGIATSLGATPVVIDNITPESLGHVELAAWLVAVEEQVGNAHTALGDGLSALALTLRSSALDYETTDGLVSDYFTTPFHDPFSPFFEPPGSGPVYGPPVPGTGPVYGPPVPGAGER